MTMTPPRPSREYSNFGLSDAYAAPDIRKQLDVIGKLGEVGYDLRLSRSYASALIRFQRPEPA